LSTTNLIRTNMGLNPGLCSENSVTDNYGTAYLNFIGQSIIIQVFRVDLSLCPSLHNCMDQSPSLETNSGSAGQQTHCLSWDLKIHYSPHKSRLSFYSILSQINAALYQIPFLLRLIISYHLRLSLPCVFSPFGFQSKIVYVFLLSLVHKMCGPLL
jgi:hypothetical protein